jgi:long-chain fatty acid transport protein
MESKTKLTLIGSALACGAVVTSSAMAGGLELYELGTPDVGLASAGYAARADDASTVFKNPAGMSRLDGSQLQGGLQAMYGSVSFTPDANTSARLGTDGGGNAIGWLPGGSLFFTQELSEKWAVGFGALSYFGLADAYNDNWVGRYYVQNSALLGFSLMPSVSFKANDWLSIGAGLNAMYGMLNVETAVNNVVGPDGQLKLKDGTWGFGANVGILIEPAKSTRIGVTYLSPVNLDFEDTPSFTGLGPGLSAILANPSSLNLGMKVPQSVMVSGYHDLNDQWAIMADFGWQNWNQFGEVNVGVEASGVTRTVNANYQDTYHGALGAQYRPCEQWRFTAGAAFDSSAVESQFRTVTMPMGQAWRFGVGAVYHASAKVDLGLAYEFMWGGSMSVDQGQDLSARGRVAGAYQDAWFSFITANLTWKF